MAGWNLSPKNGKFEDFDPSQVDLINANGILKIGDVHSDDFGFQTSTRIPWN